jgi:hypothetical protein
MSRHIATAEIAGIGWASRAGGRSADDFTLKNGAAAAMTNEMTTSFPTPGFEKNTELRRGWDDEEFQVSNYSFGRSNNRAVDIDGEN